jgi:hypothetical protein
MVKRPTSNLTDEKLRHEIEAGDNDAEIAQKYGVSRQAVSKRRNRLQVATVAHTVMQPAEAQRYVSAQVDIMLHLGQLIEDMQKLRDAYRVALRDAHAPDKFDVGPTSHEVVVTYFDSDEGKTRIKNKATLQALLNMVRDGGIIVDSTQTKIADPRIEMRQCVGEVRQILTLANNLMEKLQEQKAMQIMFDNCLKVIEDVDARMGTEHKVRVIREFKRVWVLGPDVSPNREEPEK